MSSNPNRYDRPGLYWTVTREKCEPFQFVTMRVTSVKISRVYGGIGDVGTYRAHEECFGRFATMTDAGRYASRLNFILAQTKIELHALDNEINRLQQIRTEMLDKQAEALYACVQDFPQMALIADKYART